MGSSARHGCFGHICRGFPSGRIPLFRSHTDLLSCGASSLLRSRSNANHLLQNQIRKCSERTIAVGTAPLGKRDGRYQTRQRFWRMGLWRISNCIPSIARPRTSGQTGFVVVSLVALIPFLLILMTVIAAGQLAMKRKLTAQALCVGEGLRLQSSLRSTLKELMKLNPQARTLRMERVAAERAVYSALATGNAPGLAAARAALAAVQAAQSALALRQQSLFARGRWLRLQSQNKLKVQLRTLRVENFKSEEFYPRALAVEPKPPASQTPDYIPVVGFPRAQNHRFSFTVELGGVLLPLRWRQPAKCEVTLKGEENQWQLKILAANAL